MTNPFFSLAETYMGDKKLLSAHLDVTYRCDLDCVHCYLDDRTQKGLETEHWLALIDELHEMNCFSVTLSGGEVLLRKDLWILLERLKEKRFFVRLKSHGRHIDGNLATRLRDAGVHAVDLSLYSLDPGPHDKIVRRKGAHQGTSNAVEHMLAAGIQVKVNNVVMPHNLGGQRALHKSLLNRGVRSDYTGQIRAQQNGDTGVYEEGLEIADLMQVTADQVRDHAEKILGGPRSKTHRPTSHKKERQCGAGHFMLYVDPKGNVTPCVNWPTTLGNITRQSMRSIWETNVELGEVRALRKSDRSECSGCAYRQACAFCPGMAFLETGDSQKPAMSMCRSAQASFLSKKQMLFQGMDRVTFFPIAKLKSNQEHRDRLQQLATIDGGGDRCRDDGSIALASTPCCNG